MDSSKGNLAGAFAAYAYVLIDLEKQGAKLYMKMAKKAYTDELAKALSPVSTDCEQHLSRLKLIKLAIGQIKFEQINEKAPNYEMKIKKADSVYDLKIINYALKYRHLKLAYYEQLHPIAINLNLTQEALLIEQTITDNRNTNTWLRQLIQNIIAPKLA